MPPRGGVNTCKDGSGVVVEGSKNGGADLRRNRKERGRDGGVGSFPGSPIVLQ